VDEELTLLRATLKRVDFFYSLNVAQLDALLQALKKSRARRGETLIRQGEVGDRFYILADGEVSVQVRSGFFGKKRIATLGQGDFFGEMALVTDQPRNASVIAEEDSALYVLRRRDFDAILMANPKIRQIIEDAINTRTRPAPPRQQPR
jgi:ATP-binding cassette subfamily B protein